MKLLHKITILGLIGLFLSGCSLVPTAWRSSRPGRVGESTPVVTSAPAQTVEELDAQVTADLETSLEADLDQIDEDLKAIDEEAKNY